MTPQRPFSRADVAAIALEIFRREANASKFLSEEGIRLVASQVFDQKITPTREEISAVREEICTLEERINGVSGQVAKANDRLLRLYSFGEEGIEDGFFQVRAKLDDKRWNDLADNMQKFGIVREAEKIVTANAILEGQKKRDLAERRGVWIRWVGTPALGALSGAGWLLLHSFAIHGHLPVWLARIIMAIQK